MTARRIGELDVVRGFALCGIHAVNVYQLVVLPELYPEGIGYGTDELPALIRHGFHQRFLPIFTLLFGVSFGIFLLRAGDRTRRPRLVLARRLVTLAALGALHQLVHPGEVLLVYAVMGLLMLLPGSFLGGSWAVAVGAVLLLIGGQFIPAYGVMPGLLLIGFGLAALRVPEGMSRRPGRVALAFIVSAVAAGGYLLAVGNGIPVPSLSLGWISLTGQLAALCSGLAYTTGLVLLLRTPLAPVLHRVLAPMGRMSLSNYLAATALILLGAPPLGIDGFDDAPAIAVLVVGIIALEAVWSTLWLRRFRYGPAEWAWRCVTWWQVVDIRRDTPRTA
ncbi:DUF418 domain-containing protein [Corynebacterium halotolerans]|uniref:Membrane spanning protein n=1 Tax=Corynebacterium halotolerans YIM 70093 = DSM 44683 TaxID=1121362 RepID=M1NRN2_9CORY|nr:DUF418 domain-containing protein [Corynebacterium halotolerans]AGF72162.1 membrane spanning protein [Corynebacterium halotolerans YIM 70093 = DSM 44683]